MQSVALLARKSISGVDSRWAVGGREHVSLAVNGSHVAFLSFRK